MGGVWVRAVAAAALCALALGGRGAAAHPFDADLYGQQIDVLVDAGELRLRVASEVPSRVVVEDLLRRYGPERRTPAEVQAFNALWLDELIAGFSMHDNGAPAPWVRRPPPELAAELQARFAVYRFELAAPLGAGEAHAINLVDANFPDQRAVRMLTLAVDPRWRLDACSMLPTSADGTVEDRTGRWGQLAADRELRLTVQARPWARWQLGRLGRLLRGVAPDAPIPAREALVGGDEDDVLRATLVLGAGLGLGLSAAAGVGLATSRWLRRKKAGLGSLDV